VIDATFHARRLTAASGQLSLRPRSLRNPIRNARNRLSPAEAAGHSLYSGARLPAALDIAAFSSGASTDP
jgi:hypothetical protein